MFSFLAALHEEDHIPWRKKRPFGSTFRRYKPQATFGGAFSTTADTRFGGARSQRFVIVADAPAPCS
jgi:hypothetical protein